MFIEKEWFSGMNLNDSATLTLDLVKREKFRLHFKNPCNTNQRICTIAINNGLNTQIFHILSE